jgi:hypothetical protein
VLCLLLSLPPAPRLLWIVKPRAGFVFLFSCVLGRLPVTPYIEAR